jgi:hypothetical protein
MLTFDLEVEQIWMAPWTLMKVAYIVQRYLPFFDTVYLTNASKCIYVLFAAWSHSSLPDGSVPNATPESCLKQYEGTISMSPLSPLSPHEPSFAVMDMLSMLFISEGILTYRTWAVWGRNMKIGILMGTVFLLFFTSSAVFGSLSIKGLICTSI